jgi:hypothetical protein
VVPQDQQQAETVTDDNDIDVQEETNMNSSISNTRTSTSVISGNEDTCLPHAKISSSRSLASGTIGTVDGDATDDDADGIHGLDIMGETPGQIDDHISQDNLKSIRADLDIAISKLDAKDGDFDQSSAVSI